jgi:hypothetical protein
MGNKSGAYSLLGRSRGPTYRKYRAHRWVRLYVGVDLRVYPLPTVEPWAHELCPIMRGKYDHS